MNEPNRPDMVKLTEEKIQKLKESVSDLPPFTGDMGKDFTNLLLKELSALSEVWAAYLGDSRNDSNVLITNHIATMQTQYDHLFSGIQMFLDGFTGETEQTTNPEEG